MSKPQNFEENVGEPQPINVKEMAETLKLLKEAVLNSQPQAVAKGKVEEAIGTEKEAKALIRQKFKEFLRDAPVGSVFRVSEAIVAQTSTAAIPTIWSAEPELLSPEGADGYFLTPIVQWKEDVKGKPGNTVNVQTIGAVAADSIISGTEPTFSASSITTVPVTLTQRGHGFYISKGDLEDIQDGTLDSLIEQSKNAVLRAVDGYFLSQLRASDVHANAGTITEAGAMAATVLAKMWGSLMAGSYKPAATIMHPVQYASLLQDDQFTNAATFGKSVVVETGQIGRYLGMDIVPLVQGTLNYGGTAGTYMAYMMSKGACAGAIKRELEIEKEYSVKDQRNYVVVSTRFGGTPVHTYGIGLITTID